MKKILLATSILALSSGVAAAADISFSGYGRVGLVYQGDNPDKTYIEQRLRLDVTASTETTSGLTLSGKIRFQTDDDRANSASGAGPSSALFRADKGGFRAEAGFIDDVLMSHDIVHLMGYTVGLSGQFDQRLNMLGAVDMWGMGRPGTVGTDNPQGLRLRQRLDSGVTVSASYTADGNNAALPGEYFQVGAAYQFDGHRIGLIYGDNSTDGDYWILGANGRFGDLGYTALIAESEKNYNTAYGASVSYKATESTAVVATMSLHGDAKSGSFTQADDLYAVGFIHNLGGGTTIRGAVGQHNFRGTTADLGLRFDF